MPLARLQNPPIKEAIITVSFAGTIDGEAMEEFRQNAYIKEAFPHHIQSKRFTIRGEQAGEIPTSIPVDSSKAEDAYTFATSTEQPRKTVQVKIGQLSYHQTTKYDSWEALLNEFRRVWDAFCEAAGKRDLQQMGLRYVNEIRIPLPMEIGFQEYLTLLPTVPPAIGEGLHGFFMQVHLPNDANTLVAFITQAFTPEGDKNLRVMLDINVKKLGKFVCNSDEMWAGLEEMRQFKNHLFEHLTTKKTQKMYE